MKAEPKHITQRDWTLLAALERELGLRRSTIADHLAAALAPARSSPSAEHRDSLLDSLDPFTRFDRFVGALADLADLTRPEAHRLLARVWDSDHWEPGPGGSQAWWVEGGPRAANAVRGFVHVRAGERLPDHTHLGFEHVFVLQGHALTSTGSELGPGDLETVAPGNAHGVQALAGGTDLLFFTVAYDGIDFGHGVVARPRDIPRRTLI